MVLILVNEKIILFCTSTVICSHIMLQIIRNHKATIIRIGREHAHQFFHLDVLGNRFAVSLVPCLLTVNTVLSVAPFTHCFMPLPGWLAFMEHALVPSTPQHNSHNYYFVNDYCSLVPFIYCQFLSFGFCIRTKVNKRIRVLQVHMMSPPGSMAHMDMSMYSLNYKERNKVWLTNENC